MNALLALASTLAVLLVLVGTLAIVTLRQRVQRLEAANREIKAAWRAEYREAVRR